MDLINILMEIIDDVDISTLEPEALKAFKGLKLRQKLADQLNEIKDFNESEIEDLSPLEFLSYSVKALYLRALIEEIDLLALIKEFHQELVDAKLIDPKEESKG